MWFGIFFCQFRLTPDAGRSTGIRERPEYEKRGRRPRSHLVVFYQRNARDWNNRRPNNSSLIELLRALEVTENRSRLTLIK